MEECGGDKNAVAARCEMLAAAVKEALGQGALPKVLPANAKEIHAGSAELSGAERGNK